MTFRPGALSRTTRAMAVGALALAGVTALPAATAHADATTSGDVIANLWEWNWDSVAAECTDVLGPNGYGAVQVAPPAESSSSPRTTGGTSTSRTPTASTAASARPPSSPRW